MTAVPGSVLGYHLIISYEDISIYTHICEGYAHVMALLLTAPGANLEVKNNAGKTAEQLAR